MVIIYNGQTFYVNPRLLEKSSIKRILPRVLQILPPMASRLETDSRRITFPQTSNR